MSVLLLLVPVLMVAWSVGLATQGGVWIYVALICAALGGGAKKPLLLQTYKRDSEEIMHDLSVPVHVQEQALGWLPSGLSAGTGYSIDAYAERRRRHRLITTCLTSRRVARA